MGETKKIKTEVNIFEKNIVKMMKETEKTKHYIPGQYIIVKTWYGRKKRQWEKGYWREL